MSANAGLFSSATDEWPTPRRLASALCEEFEFTLDPCADANNAVCGRFFTREQDGLSQPWRGRVYVNPPYGRRISNWVEKAYDASRSTAELVVCLLPSRTDTAWWHTYVMAASEVRFIEGRLNFESEAQAGRVAGGESMAHNAPFPSALVVFDARRPGLRVVAMSREGRPLPPPAPGARHLSLWEAL